MKNKNISPQVPSALSKTDLAFEYDITWQDAKKAVRIRTHRE
jgi:hypothetical protein